MEMNLRSRENRVPFSIMGLMWYCVLFSKSVRSRILDESLQRDKWYD